MSAIAYEEKISPSNLAKVIEVCQRLAINPSWLMFVMNFETGGKFLPSVRNAIGSVGLIQFTRDKAGVQYKTINGVRYQLADLAEMTFAEQMEVVYQYYKPFKGKIHSAIDCYMVTFFPVALGKPDDYVLQTAGLSAALIAKQNPVFVRSNPNAITKGDVTAYFAKLSKEKWSLITQGETRVNPAIANLMKVVDFAVIPLAVFFYSFYIVQL